MRQFAEADRKLDKELNKRRGRRGRVSTGCIGGLIKMLIVVGGLWGAGYLIWWWHPWGSSADTIPAAEIPGTCPDGVNGYVTRDYFTLFGQRVYQTGQSTICTE